MKDEEPRMTVFEFRSRFSVLGFSFFIVRATLSTVRSEASRVSRFLTVCLLALLLSPALRAQEIEVPVPFPITDPNASPSPVDMTPPPVRAPAMTPAPTNYVSPFYPSYPQPMFAPDPPAPSAFTTKDVFRDHLIWGGAEYSMWWFRKAPLAVPLVVTTSTAPGPDANILGKDPNAHVVLGPGQVDGNVKNGGRAWLGFWFGVDASLGMEFVGLWIEDPGERRGVQSNAAGFPLYSRPFLMPDGTPGVYDISFPGAVRGGLFMQNHQFLRGLEANFVTFAFGDHRLAFNFLAGGRFLDLDERLNLNYSVTNLITMPAFGGDVLAPGATITALDRYQTYNRFYGAQVGSRIEGNFGRLSLAFAGKIAFGVNDMILQVDGQTTRSDIATLYPAGVLANTANIGRYHESHYAFVPEGSLSVGWWFTPHLRFQVGYNVLYISDVIRPGSQITSTINPAAVPVDQTFGAVPVTRTSPQFLRTDFWAEGITFGFDFRY
jgi:hypothetical protein